MNINEFDWTLVRSFLAALEHGSLLGAARASGASQPTLGRHIAALEQQLGVVLFERTGRGLAPTEQAQRLADSARVMQEGAQAMLRAVSGQADVTAGVVRIAASQPVACVLLPPLLARMRIELPEVRADLVVSNAVSNLLRREADIALRMVRPEQASLVMRRIGEVPIQACAHRDYLVRRGTPRVPPDLINHDLIGGDTEDEVAQGFIKMGMPPERIRFALRSDDLIAQWQAVRAGMGVGFVARYVMRTDRDIVPLLPMLPLPRFPVWLTVHREIRSSARIRAVWDFLARAVADELVEAG